MEEAHCDDAEGTVVLLANELVTNAILHTSSQVSLEVDLAEDRIRVAVRDDSPQPPVRRRAPTQSTSGRGLDLVQALATAWGVEWVPDDGKAVWFEVRLRP